MTIPYDESGHPVIVRLVSLEGAITNNATAFLETTTTNNVTITKIGTTPDNAKIIMEGAITRNRFITWLENGNKGYIWGFGLIEFDGSDWIGVETKPAYIFWRTKNAFYAF